MDTNFSGVGKVLYERYKDKAKVKELISHGNLSSIGNEVNPVPRSQVNVYLFYHRDHKEDWEVCKPKRYGNEDVFWDTVDWIF